MECEYEWLRDVIKGEIKFRKCPVCDNEGIEHQSYNEHGEPCDATHPEALRYTCESCKGLAFIEIPSCLQ